MNEIKEYLIVITVCSVVAAIADIITSSMSEKHPDIARTVSLGLTLCILSAILLPMLKKPLEYAEEDNATVFDCEIESTETDRARFLEKEVELATKDYIFKKTGIKPSSVGIEIVAKDNGIEIIDAEIALEKECSDYEQSVIVAAQEAIGRDVRIIYVD